MAKMKAGTLDPQLKDAVTSAYKLGMMDGEKKHCKECRNKLISAMTTTNANLWEILNDLDKIEPIEGLVLSFKDAEDIIAALRSGKRKTKLANILRRRVRESSQGLRLFLAEVQQSE